MKHLLHLLLAILGTAAFSACSDNKNNEGVITMVVESYYSGNYDSLTIYTFNEGDEISIDYGNGYAPIVISTKLEEDHNGISIRDGIKYGYILKYTFPNKGEHTITIKGNISGLDCSTNPSTSLDISKCTALAYLNCWYNQLTSLDISKNTALIELDCSENQLTSLDVSKNTALDYLACGGNQLTSLDVSKNTKLTSLSCSHNQLTSLDVSKNTALICLTCFDNQLTSLDISKNTALTRLGCGDNELTSLDITKNTSLDFLACFGNPLTSLDISKNTALTRLNCSENPFTAEEMNKIYETLPNVGYDENGKPQGILNCDPLGNWSIAEKKGWEVSFYNEFNRLFTSFHL